MDSQLPYAILASDLDKPQAKLLGTMLRHARLERPTFITDTLATGLPPHLLSIGRAGTQVWHEFDLVRVEHNHGQVFTHIGARTSHIMVLQHPGSAQQPNLMGGMSVRHEMVADLVTFREWLEGRRQIGQLRPRWCAKCLAGRGRGAGVKRQANYYLEPVDNIPLCDDHWRKRAAIRRKAVKKPKAGSREAQLEGQGEMFRPVAKTGAAGHT